MRSTLLVQSGTESICRAAWLSLQSKHVESRSCYDSLVLFVADGVHYDDNFSSLVGKNNSVETIVFSNR